MSRVYASGSVSARHHFPRFFRLLSPRLWILGCFPSSTRTQAAIIEMLSQGIESKISLPKALDRASKMMRGFPLGDLLGRAADMVRSGETVPDSLRRAGMPLNVDFVAAFEVGADQGDLGGELAAAARRLDARVADHVAAAIGRRKSARQFATTLARLLAQKPLTCQSVDDAARLVGAHDRAFRPVIQGLSFDVEGGLPFDEALLRYPKVFDSLFVSCVANARSRDEMRNILSRIGIDQ